MARELFPRLVSCAAMLLGSERALARYLGVPVAQVEAWLEGRAVPPSEVFPRLSALLARDVHAVVGKVVGTNFRLGSPRAGA